MKLGLVALLNRPTTMMVGGLAAGLLTGFSSEYSAALAMAALAILMVASLSELELTGFRAATRRALLAFPASFLCLSGFLLLTGALFPEEFHAGWVLMAAVPSAISVVPFTSVLGGDTRLSLAATVLLYLSALAVTPILTLWLAAQPVDVGLLVQALLLLVVLPLVVSRGLRKLRVSRPQLHLVRNLSFFGLILVLTGANRDTIINDPVVAVGILGACALAVLLSVAVWGTLTRGLSLETGQRRSLLLFSSYKNNGLAGTLAFTLFGAQSALPPVMMGVFEIIWISALLQLFAAPHSAGS